jgi:hypothetical protein
MDEADTDRKVVSTHEDTPDWRKLTEYMTQSMIALDGLWFMNVLKELGPEKTLEIDIKVITGQFKIAARLWRKLMQLDGTSLEDKQQIFDSLARLYGHNYQVLSDDKTVTMRLKRCTILENLKRTGRASEHDCRKLCTKLAPEWFQEIEPRTKGEGWFDFQLPVGGAHCDWTVVHPSRLTAKLNGSSQDSEPKP